MKKLICLAVLTMLPLGYVVAECIGNTTQSVSCTSVESDPDGGPFDTIFTSEEWCCTPVGDGSDSSCTNGTSWELSSDLGCGTPAPL